MLVMHLIFTRAHQQSRFACKAAFSFLKTEFNLPFTSPLTYAIANRPS